MTLIGRLLDVVEGNCCKSIPRKLLLILKIPGTGCFLFFFTGGNLRNSLKVSDEHMQYKPGYILARQLQRRLLDDLSSIASRISGPERPSIKRETPRGSETHKNSRCPRKTPRNRRRRHTVRFIPASCRNRCAVAALSRKKYRSINHAPVYIKFFKLALNGAKYKEDNGTCASWSFSLREDGLRGAYDISPVRIVVIGAVSCGCGSLDGGQEKNGSLIRRFLWQELSRMMSFLV
ncbi:hypothetical protein GWI33_014332 [Rhynchophorus ferrugineus]|uniref:Uncharacterized protein n=1 Tax=Rhynchophorus ferrugineus TaxID=354439 RepID=A0A834I1V2_RHYFE|nr:hypothetical protein GWI33_014332 [Rhynchophorus ferrugineus]